MTPTVARTFCKPATRKKASPAGGAAGVDQRQRQTQGRVMPNRFTHGTPAQRAAWFRRGHESGSPIHCDTREAEELFGSA